MSFWKELVGGGDIVKNIMGGLDNLFTSEEDRLKAKLAIKQALYASEDSARKFELALEEQITTRHKNDMLSDSWLSKNVRPLGLITVTLSFTLLSYLTVFYLPIEEAKKLETILDFWSPILMTMIMFYYGGRSFEKHSKHNYKEQKEKITKLSETVKDKNVIITNLEKEIKALKKDIEELITEFNEKES